MKIKRTPEWVKIIKELYEFIIIIFGSFIGFKKCNKCNKWFWLNKDYDTRYVGHDWELIICEDCIDEIDEYFQLVTIYKEYKKNIDRFQKKE